jgi:photosystem II stability/assembly factor-like uncharacterized protein
MRPSLAIVVLTLVISPACGGSGGHDDRDAPAQSTATLTPIRIDAPTPSATPTEAVAAPIQAFALGYAAGADASRPTYVALQSDDGGETWQVIRRSSRRFGTIAFHDRQRGLLTSQAGAILRTADGGATWLEVRAVTDNADVQLSNAAFADADTATVVGGVFDPRRGTTVRPILIRTRDAGTTWSDASIMGSGQVAVATMFLQHVCFSESGIGLAVGFGAVAPGTFEVGVSALVVLLSNDDGSVWKDVTDRLGLGIPTAASVSAISCKPDGTLWLVGQHAPRLVQRSEPLQLVSRDAGATWNAHPFDSEFSPSMPFTLGDIALTASGAGWAVSAPTASTETVLLFHSADGGASWRQQQRPLIDAGGIARAQVAAADPERAIVVGESFSDRILGPFVWYTRDGGRTPWRAGRLPDDVRSLQDVTVAVDRD